MFHIEESRHFECKCIYMSLITAIVFLISGCTDYEAMMADAYEEWVASLIEESSSSQKLSSFYESSSSLHEESCSSSGAFMEYGFLADLRDGKMYKTVQIGDQIWMAENLNYERTGSYCYGANSDNCTAYGRLYTWVAAMDGACPVGWHLPSNAEFETLIAAVGGGSVAGKVLKSVRSWDDYKGESGNGMDSFGFSALPAGYRSSGGYFYDLGVCACFWSASDYYSSNSYAYYMGLYNDYDNAKLNYNAKFTARSVRCLRDFSSISPAESSSSAVVKSSSGMATSSNSAVIVTFSSSVGKFSSSSAIVVSCSEYKCVSTEYLNQELLAAGKYGYLVDMRDSQVYRTIEIGEQTWMAQNLNYAYNQETSSLDSSSFCFDNKQDSCAKYGRLYLWSAAMDSAGIFANTGKGCGYEVSCEISGTVRGVCPEGWHLPTKSGFETLFSAVGGQSVAGRALKSTSGWYDNGDGMDSYGFSALPAGYRYRDGGFSVAGNFAYFWSVSELGGYDVYNMNLYYNFDYSYLNNIDKDLAWSVRCLRD